MLPVVINVLNCSKCKSQYETGILAGPGVYVQAIRLIDDGPPKFYDLSMTCPNCQSTLEHDAVARVEVADSEGNKADLLIKFPPPAISRLN